MNKSKVIGIVGLVLTVFIGTGVPLVHSFGVRINKTESAPTGLYIVKKVAPKKGALVEICPPNVPVIQLMSQRGYMQSGMWGNCEDLGVSPLLKPISALDGDVVEITPGQPVKVNGIVLPNTQAMSAIPGYPQGKYIVGQNQFWAFSTYNVGSIDSRYFGPLSISNIKGNAKPILINGDISKVSMGVVSND